MTKSKEVAKNATAAQHTSEVLPEGKGHTRGCEFEVISMVPAQKLCVTEQRVITRDFQYRYNEGESSGRVVAVTVGSVIGHLKLL